MIQEPLKFTTIYSEFIVMLYKSIKRLNFFLKIIYDFSKGFIGLRNIGPCVTVFGSAMLNQTHNEYINVKNLGCELARLGFAVMTGGGPGLMEAANSGAKLTGGLSIGCCINLAKQENPNPYLDLKFIFNDFFIRKYMLSNFSCAFVVAPGGFGTLDELFEIITLVKTSKISPCPIYLLNKNYWEPIIFFAQNEMIHLGTIKTEDLNLIKILDDPLEIAFEIKNYLNKTPIYFNSKSKSIEKIKHIS